MKLVHIQQALFAAYDIRNAMTTDDMYRPTEGESVGECLAEIINTLENIKAEMERHHKVITIGRFTVVYQWLPEVAFCGTAFGWEAFEPDEFYDSPEQKHLEKVSDSLRASYSNEEYMDELIAALASNPFDVEALPTPRMSPSMPAWRWCNYPEWCMTDTPTEGKEK